MLEAVSGGLPYGRYTVTPLAPLNGKTLPERECLLGVCRENDTVSTDRLYAMAKFQV